MVPITYYLTKNTGDQGEVFQEFKEQLLQRSPGGSYQTGLTRKGHHPALPTGKDVSLRR